MAILSPINRRSWRGRLLVGAIYALLTAGAACMVIPLGLVLAGSTKSVADQREARLVPGFLQNEQLLWQKHLEALFNESVDAMNIALDTSWTTFADARLPAEGEAPGEEWVEAWEAFLASGALPAAAFLQGHYWAPQAGAFPVALRGFREALQWRFGTLDALNQALGTDFETWYDVFAQPPATLFPHSDVPESAVVQALRDYTATSAPAWTRSVACAEGYWHRLFLKPRYGPGLEEVNRALGTGYRSWAEIPFPETLHLMSDLLCEGGAPEPEEGAAAAGVEGENAEKPEDSTVISPRDAGEAATWMMEPTPAFGVVWRQFAGQSLSSRWRTVDGRLRTPDHLWNAWLRETGRVPADGAWVPMPQLAYHARLFRENRTAIRREFLWRNYRTVLDYVLFHGRGILNTVVYCALAVLLALLVNPLAAYALSRAKLRATNQVLFFLMLTMAFPHMVTQIPVFILLRELGLLNTFAALLLPGMASGYSIFLLKGFFDSLPQELYESAQIDGAGEWTLFWQLTMRLSTPILSVIALQAFTVAYANFMYALLICQSPKMWTLMVWLYQLQQRSGPGVVQASLILAAIPTLAVFLACQRVLLRGIVVPVEK